MKEEYKGCAMTTYFNDQETDLSDCYVIFENERKDVHVHYREDGYIVQYTGSEVAPGHYELKCVKGSNGEASLHEENGIMVGVWKECGNKGAWVIDLIK